MMTSDELEKLIVTEAQYYANVATVEKTPCAWFLHSPVLADYRSANCALRLRDDGCGPEAVAGEVITYYRQRNLSPVADVDAIAEQQGIGAALRRLGITPVTGSILLMRYAASSPPVLSSPHVFIEVIPRETGAGEAQEWVDLVAGEEVGTEYEAFWYEVIAAEARGEGRTQYLARINGHAAGACELFIVNDWGRIDDVYVRPEFRRRGVASALIRRAVHDALINGCRQTYLFTEAGGMAEPLYRKLGFDVWAVNALRRHIAS